MCNYQTARGLGLQRNPPNRTRTVPRGQDLGPYLGPYTYL